MGYHKGFTLVELLVVIVIIGILATLATVAVSSARGRARDAKRVSDLKQISTALEMYYADYFSYPNLITPGQALTSPDGSKTYMSKVPNNPTPWAEDACTSGSDYVYNPVGGLTDPPSYNISGCLAKGTGSLAAGEVAMTPTGLNSVTCPARICGDCSTTACGGTCATNITKDAVTYAETYPTVQIGGQCWMTKSITNVGTMTTGVVYADDAIVERACYDNLQANCDTDGALYAWNEAMYLPASAATTQFTAYTGSGANAKRQGICPVGWHIPSDKEFATLENYLDPVINDGTNYFADQMGTSGTTGWRPTTVNVTTNPSRKMKSARTALGSLSVGIPTNIYPRWDYDAVYYGTDTAGFSALPAGEGLVAAFTYRGMGADFWSSSQYSATNAWRRILYSYRSQSYRSSDSKNNGFSVRCLKD